MQKAGGWCGDLPFPDWLAFARSLATHVGCGLHRAVIPHWLPLTEGKFAFSMLVLECGI